MRIAIGLSGGTDSAAAALLLKRAGDTPVGITLILCGNEDVSGAARIADTLGIEYHSVDMRKQLRTRVMEPFAAAWRRGETPNPCVLCNQAIKFGAFFDVAAELGCEIVATGHYARTVFRDGAWRLYTGLDQNKDQSYFLWTLTSEKLARIHFPLGKLTKTDARRIVNEASLPVQSRESQDVCFIPDGDCGGFLNRFCGVEPGGQILGTDGSILGAHRGLGYYTVGQRRGLGVSALQPLYVTEKNWKENTVILGEECDLYKKRVYLRNVRFISGAPVPDGDEVEAKVRYTRTASPAQFTSVDKDVGILTFTAPVRAPAPGQSAVLMRQDEVLGGGIIVGAE